MLQQESIQFIYWFAPYNLNCPSTRYRGKYPLEHLFQHYGIRSEFVFPDRSIMGMLLFTRIYLSALLFRKPNSLIVIQKVCSNRLYANALKILIRLQPKSTQYDLDDAEYLRQDKKTLVFFLKNCQSITVGSQALKNYCLQFNTNVSILTSPVKDHKVLKSKRNNVVHVGWVGDLGNGDGISKEFSHKTSMFSILFPHLRKVKIPMKLTLIGVKNEADIPEIIKYFEKSPNISLEIDKNMNWQEDDWLYPKIATFDIGVSPMTDHPFNQCKSAFKTKQYLSVGVPVLASDVGENKKFAFDNKNGFLCKTGIDFLNAINRIANMDDIEYFKMSKNALSLKRNYSIDNYCRLLLGKPITHN